MLFVHSTQRKKLIFKQTKKNLNFFKIILFKKILQLNLKKNLKGEAKLLLSTEINEKKPLQVNSKFFIEITHDSNVSIIFKENESFLKKKKSYLK